MKKKDKKLLNEFVRRVKKLKDLEAIILFGSLARGEETKSSDIDILLIFDHKDPESFSQRIFQIVTNLKPHREIKPIFTNLTEYDESFYRNVFREGKVLYGKIVLSPKDLALKPAILIKYDLRDVKKSIKDKVSRVVHGYTSKKSIEGEKKEYHYKGLKEEEEVELISNSVLLMKKKKAEGFIEFLDRKGVSYQKRKIWI